MTTGDHPKTSSTKPRSYDDITEAFCRGNLAAAWRSGMRGRKPSRKIEAGAPAVVEGDEREVAQQGGGK